MQKPSYNNQFISLCLAQFIASLGHGLTSFALSVRVYEIRGSALDTSLVLLCSFLPTVLLLIPAGVLADRYDRRLLMIAGDGLSILGLLIIFLADFNGTFELWQILLAVTISSIFQSLLEPAYKATVTDLVPEEDYTKSSGLIQIASTAKFLLAPFLAGLLLEHTSLKLILLLDIGTIFITVLTTLYVRRDLPNKPFEKEFNGFAEVILALKHIAEKKGILHLVGLATCMTFFLGIFQSLANPYFLSFSNSKQLGMVLSIASSGMLLSAIILSVLNIKKAYVTILALSLSAAGIFMIGFGYSELLPLLITTSFLFFAMLPFANASLDALIRSNIDNHYQGRVWAILGFISQMGYVIAYPLSGFLADYFFTPAFLENGFFASSLGRLTGIGPSRGMGWETILSGICLIIISLYISQKKSVRRLEINDSNI